MLPKIAIFIRPIDDRNKSLSSPEKSDIWLSIIQLNRLTQVAYSAGSSWEILTTCITQWAWSLMNESRARIEERSVAMIEWNECLSPQEGQRLESQMRWSLWWHGDSLSSAWPNETCATPSSMAMAADSPVLCVMGSACSFRCTSIALPNPFSSPSLGARKDYGPI